MEKDDQNAKESLIKLRNSIKKKYQQLHNQKQSMNEALQDYYEPITTPLQELVSNINISKKTKKANNKDNNVGDYDYDYNYDDDFSTVKQTKQSGRRLSFDDDDFIQTRPQTDEDDDALSDKTEYSTFESSREEGQTPRPSRSNSVTEVESSYFGNVNSTQLADYMDILGTNANDSSYGIKSDSNMLLIGRSLVQLNENEIKVGGNSFSVTHGLLSLLFYKVPPKNYSTEDLENYKQILLLTNAHKKYFEKKNKIRTSKMKKFTDIIEPMFKEGKGVSNYNKEKTKKKKKNNRTCLNSDLMVFTDKKPNYVYWNTGDELVERL